MIEKAFGTVLQSYRKKQGYSQEKLAFICHLDRTYISLLERGLRGPSLRTIFTLAKGLDISPSQLIEEVEQKTME